MNYQSVLSAKMIAVALLMAGVQATPVHADSPLPVSMSGTWMFDAKDGEALYKSSCQGCHMADGKGARGAGFYPSLAGNSKLDSAALPISVLLRGQNGMPSFREYMTDAQIAAVVNYVRTHFGNDYKDKATEEDVPH
ncbi:MAG: cytochrome c [Zoogloeaceae bacterium]|jgi:mono/diheme cytochrome c family protein|nr:cytochrome c [Zoogloeaceae bacterium]